MSQKPESVFRKRVRAAITELKYTCMIPIQQKAIRGVPDFLLCVNGAFVALELKSTGNCEASKLQRFWLNEIHRAGGVGIVTCPECWPVTLRFLKQASGEKLLPNDAHPTGH